MIWELRHEFKIWLLIDIAGIPRSTYYYYSKQFNSPKPDKYADVKAEIRRIYDESKGRYGYRRITKELKKKYVINHKTVQRLMRKMGIFCRVRMRKYNSYKGDVGRIAPNLLERDFKAKKPNQKWVTDVTEFALFGIKQSMSRKGNCLDNACAENFFSLLKTELLYLQEFSSVEHFISELTEYIDWYNNKRIKLKLDGLSPVEYRKIAA